MTTIIRKLARSRKYQFLYSRAKEIPGINLFNNITDFTAIQIKFLQWLSIYDSLYQDLYRKEEFISEEVIEDDLRAEAYLFYKSLGKKESKTQQKVTKLEKEISGTIPSVIFKEGGK